MSIQVINLHKVFGQQKAVNDISFTAENGQVVGFLGPNGAGKSTTMKIATGYISATSGQVLICGEDIEDASRSLRKKIGYLPEHNPLYLDLYVKEYLAMVASLTGVPGNRRSKRVAEMVEKCGLQAEQSKKIGALSKGYRQRVGLAQAMIHDPEVLILDEPTSGLDPNQIIEIRSLIKDFSRDKTVLLSTHIMQEVQALCDRVVILNHGKIVANRPLEGLARAGIRTFRLTLDQPVPDLDFPNEWDKSWQEGEMVFFQSSEDIRGRIFKWASELNLPAVELKEVEYSLEEIFHQLTN